MAEIRVNSTGGVKLFDADDSHYAQIKAGTISSNTDVLELGSSAVVAGTKVDLNGQELILDADADTSITADTDDQIDVRIAGADDFQFTANTFTAQSGSSIVVPDGGLTFGSTAISSTAAELNILDGVTSTAAELNILDGVTSTAAELNIVDGNTSATSTTIADADRVVLNDNGTMVQAAVTDLKTYIGSGTHVLLSSTNVTSNVSNVTFQSQFSDTYTNYYLTGRGINKSESSHLMLRFLNGGTTDSGSNYDDVYGVGMRSRSSTTWTGRHNSQSEIQFIESAGVNTATFTMWIDTSFRGTSTHDYVNLHGIESHWYDDSNGYITATFGGVYLPNTNVDGIKFITSSGTITSGRFSLYGVKHA